MKGVHSMAMQFPKGKFISVVKVGEKGQIVIPKGAREMFDIRPGDNLLLLADLERGIALVSLDEDADIFNTFDQMRGGDLNDGT